MLLKSHYETLTPARHEFLERGHRSSVLTIPSILPRDGQRGLNLPQNFQSVGSRAVNGLSSKLLLTLFPPSQPFMRLEVSEADMQTLAGAAESAEQGRLIRQEIEQNLMLIESQAMSLFDTGGWRPAVAEGVRQLIVTGNVCIYDRPGGRPAAYDLRNYVVERDAEGTLLKVILKLVVDPYTVYQRLGGRVTLESIQALSGPTATSGIQDGVEVYVGALMDEDGTYTFSEEVGDQIISLMSGLKEAELPLLPLRFRTIYGESYGRGYVEDFDGDLLTLETLRRALAEGAMASAKMLMLVKPGGYTKPETISKAPNCAVRSGDVDDVGVLQMNKSADLSVPLSLVSDITRSVLSSFLAQQSIQRSGERVTAEEIRMLAQELEDTLGTVYSSLADTVQLPIVAYFITKMKKRGDIKKLPKGVEVVIASGLESISRNHKAGRIQQFLGMALTSLPPEEVVNVVDSRKVMMQLATALNLPAKDLLRSEEEIAQRQQQQQQAALAEQVAGPATSALLTQ